MKLREADIFLFLKTVRLDRASNIIIWNSRFMRFLGLWPPKVNNFLCTFFSVYMVIFCIMGMNHLIKHLGQLKDVIGNLTDNIFLSMILGKILICRRNCKIMAKFLQAIEQDFLINTYDSVQEKTAYLRYNELAISFSKISVIATGFTAVFYYLRMYIANWRQCKYVQDSKSLTYLLRYLNLSKLYLISGGAIFVTSIPMFREYINIIYIFIQYLKNTYIIYISFEKCFGLLTCHEYTNAYSEFTY